MIIIDCETEINFVFHVKHIIGCCSWLMSDRADAFRRYGTRHRTLFVVSEIARDIKAGGSLGLRSGAELLFTAYLCGKLTLFVRYGPDAV